jgi:hypothetical protein
MVRAILVAFGVGLLLLWVVGLADQAASWLTWLVGIVGLLAILAAVVMPEHGSPAQVAAGPTLLGFGLIAMWVVALATRTSPWLAWWTFAFGGGLVVFGGMAALERRLKLPLAGSSPG